MNIVKTLVFAVLLAVTLVFTTTVDAGRYKIAEFSDKCEGDIRPLEVLKWLDGMYAPVEVSKGKDWQDRECTIFILATVPTTRPEYVVAYVAFFAYPTTEQKEPGEPAKVFVIEYSFFTEAGEQKGYLYDHKTDTYREWDYKNMKFLSKSV